MQTALKTILLEAIEKVVSWEIESTQRHLWLFDYPEQQCMTGTQIYWTDETQMTGPFKNLKEDKPMRSNGTCNFGIGALLISFAQLVGTQRSYGRRQNRKKINHHHGCTLSLVMSSIDIFNKIGGPSAFAWQ